MAFLREIQIPFGVVSGRAAGIKLKSNVELLAVVTPRDKSLHERGTLISFSNVEQYKVCRRQKA